MGVGTGGLGVEKGTKYIISVVLISIFESVLFFSSITKGGGGLGSGVVKGTKYIVSVSVSVISVSVLFFSSIKKG